MIIYADSRFNNITSKVTLEENMCIYDKNKIFNVFLKDIIGKSFSAEKHSNTFYVLCSELSEWNAILAEYYITFIKKKKQSNIELAIFDNPNLVTKETICFPMARIILKQQSFDLVGPFSISTEIFSKDELKKIQNYIDIESKFSIDKTNDKLYILLKGKNKKILDNLDTYKQFTKSIDSDYICFYGFKKKILMTKTISIYEDFFGKIKRKIKSCIDNDLFILRNGIDLNVNYLFPILQNYILQGLSALCSIKSDNNLVFDFIQEKNIPIIKDNFKHLDLEVSMFFKKKKIELEEIQLDLLNNCSLFISQPRIAAKFIIGKSLSDLFHTISPDHKMIGENENLFNKCIQYYVVITHKILKEMEFLKNRILRKYLVNHYRLFYYVQDLILNNSPINIDQIEKKMINIKYQVLECLKMIEEYNSLLEYNQDIALPVTTIYFDTKKEAEETILKNNIPFFTPTAEKRISFYNFFCLYQIFFQNSEEFMKSKENDNMYSEPFYMITNKKWCVLLVNKNNKGILEYIYDSLRPSNRDHSYQTALMFDFQNISFHDYQGVVNLFQYNTSKPFNLRNNMENNSYIDLDESDEEKKEEEKILSYIFTENGASRDTIEASFQKKEIMNNLIADIANYPEILSLNNFNKMLDTLKKFKKNNKLDKIIPLIESVGELITKLRYTKKFETSLEFNEYLSYILFFKELYKNINKNLENTDISINKGSLKYYIYQEIKKCLKGNVTFEVVENMQVDRAE